MASAKLLVAGLGLLLAAPLAAQQRRVTLDEAVRMSEMVQPNVVQAGNTVRSNAAATRAAWAQYLPNLSASSSGNRSFSEGPSRLDPTSGQIISGDQTNQSFSFGVNAGIELFDGFRRSNALKAARATESASEASYDNVRFQNRLTTTNAFLDALAAQQQIRVLEASVARAEEQLKVAVARLQSGAANRADSLRAFVTLGQARLQLLQQQNTLATAEANLGRQVGIGDRVAAQDDSALYARPAALDTTTLRTDALRQAPTVRAAELQLVSAKANFGQSKSTYWPTLSMSFGNTWAGNQLRDYEIFQSRSVGLSLNWQLFNRFQREQQVTQASLQVDNAQATLNDARRQVEAQLTQRLAELGTAEQQVAFSGLNVQAATEELRIVTERYRLGVATIVDVVTSQEQLTTAEGQAVTARFAYLRAKAQLEALVGRSL